MKTLTLFSALLFFMGNCLATPTPVWTGNPMRPGIAALTCTSSGDQTATGLNEHVLAFLDVRDPSGCGATSLPGAWTLTPARMFWPSNNAWSVANLGEVFGVDVGVGNASHVYVAAAGPKPCNWGGSNIWNNRPYNTSALNAGGGGEVWRIDGTTHVPFLLASLPNHRGYFQGAPLGGGAFTCVNGNSFVGLGQVSVNTKPGVNKVYVSNMDDGKIYTLTDGIFNATYPCPPFDHGATKPIAYGSTLADDPLSLYTQKSRLVFGLEYHPQLNRLFYALRNALNQDEVWSIGLDAVGCPTGQQCLEFVSPSWTGPAVGNFPGASVAPSLPGDIQFSDDGCRMLVTQLSIRYEVINATSITPAFAGPIPQLSPMHYAHSSVGYEARINNNPPCNPSFTRWTYIDRYLVGANNYSPYCNSVAGDYGYSSIFNSQAVDSVVLVADVIRPLFPTYNFGLQIQPIGDFTRTNLLANFDVPLLSGNPSVQATKIQLNDVDILHKDSCMKVVTSAVSCPVGAGGQHKVTINITNTSSMPYWGIALSNCAPSPVMPGATPITPVFQTPPNINLGNPLNPGSSTGPLVVCLPGIPPAGGMFCFCVNMLSEVEGPPLCQQMVCITAPECIPPCANIEAQNVACDHAMGNFVFSLCVSNLQPQPITSIKFAPCPGSGGGGGAPGPMPTPNPFVLPNPLPNGATAYYPFTLPAPFTNGGQYCFEVTLCGGAPNDPHPIILCKKKVCLELPPCDPYCMELTPLNVTCPTVTGGAYTLNLQIKNLTATPATQVVFSMCSPPLPGCTPVLPSPSSITLGSPLLPNATTIVPVSLPGLPCTGLKACFCVTLFNQEPPSPTNPEGPIIVLCKGSVCVQLPVCPCPPCMKLTAGTVLCPTVAGSPYTFTFTIQNLQATPMALFGVSQCAVPAGSSPVQPTPAGPSVIPGGPLALNATSQPITVSLPVPLTGGSYCFCVTTLAADQQTVLCSERICVNLPSCRCGEISHVDAVCNPGTGLTQVTFTITNFTNLYASPYNFDLATFTPSLGYSSITLTPNPIVPGATGTVTATYVGPPGNTCATIVMSNANRTRCCTLKACFNNPECLPVPTHPDSCTMPPEFICEGGVANLLVYINNNSVLPRGYNWTISPATFPGCTGNLPPGAFSPSSGTTATIGAFSSVGVNCTVNTASLLPGQCAGFQLCFTPRGAAPGTPPICCKGKIVCPRPVDPCIGIGNPTTVIAPGKTIGIPIIIKNPTTVVLEASLVPSDMDGLLTFSRSGSVARTSDGEDNPDIITDEAPYTISLMPNEVYETMFYASYVANIPKTGPGIIVIGPPCIGRNVDDHYYHGRHLIYGPSVTSTDVPIKESLGDISPLIAPGHMGMTMPFKAQQGLVYHIRACQALDFSPLAAYLLTPVGGSLVVEADGSFYSPTGECDLGILRATLIPREFYSISRDPITVPFVPAMNNDR